MKDQQQAATRIGRPRSEVATSHAAIMDAVHDLLTSTSARDLTMDAVAKRAGVTKPTLYKWWPSKTALIMAMFHERLAAPLETPRTVTVEEAIRHKMRRLITEFNGLFGRVIADLIAEGQHNPAVLQELTERHIRPRRASVVQEIERGKDTGELWPDVDSELLIDAIFGPVYYRHLLRLAPLTQEYGAKLVEQGFRTARTTPRASKRKL